MRIHTRDMRACGVDIHAPAHAQVVLARLMKYATRGEQCACVHTLTACLAAMLVGPPRDGIQKKPLVNRPSSAALVRALGGGKGTGMVARRCYRGGGKTHACPAQQVAAVGEIAACLHTQSSPLLDWYLGMLLSIAGALHQHPMHDAKVRCKIPWTTLSQQACSTRTLHGRPQTLCLHAITLCLHMRMRASTGNSHSAPARPTSP